MTPRRRRSRGKRKTAKPLNTSMTPGEETSPAAKYAAFRNKQAFEKTEVGCFASSYPFELDTFQIRACQALASGKDVLVSAPTSSGKTIVAEFAVDKALREGTKLFYTTPIKALSNQKFHDLSKRFGRENLGLLTGDTAVNPNAPIVVMTTEVARNMIYAGSKDLQQLGYVVMDEVHYLADKFRGPVWEEVLINLASEVRVIALSATVSNVEDFGKWLSSIRRPTKVIVSNTRPVPLEQYMFMNGQIIPLYKYGSQKINPRLRLSQSYNGHHHFAMQKRARVDRPKLCLSLQEEDMLPAIVFVFSRAGCETAVEEIVNSGLSFTSQEQAERIEQIAQSALAELTDSEYALVGGPEWIRALCRGVAAHHAGLLPLMKEVVERLFIEGLLQVIFATETLSLGVNMPARTVVIEQLDKWNGSEHLPLTAGQYTQLTGRAGRRGIDDHGYAVTILSQQSQPYVVAALASKRSYPLHSAFVPTYNMTVNLLCGLDYDRACRSIEKSFAQWEAEHAVRKLSSQARKAANKAEEKIQSAVCSRGDVMELDSMMRQLSSLEKKARARRFSSNNTEELKAADRSAIEEARARLKSHPVYNCDNREMHLVLARAAYQARLRAENLDKQIAMRTTSLSAQFGRVVKVLQHLGYLDKQVKLTHYGEVLRGIYGEKDLLVSQCLHNQVWSGLSTSQMAAVLAAVVYTSRFDIGGPVIPGGASSNLAQVLRRMHALNAHIQDLELHFHLPPGRHLDTGFCVAMEVWARGKSLGQAMGNANVSAGEFVRWARQVVDLADQLSKCAPDPQVAGRCKQVIRAVKRGVVAWEY